MSYSFRCRAVWPWLFSLLPLVVCGQTSTAPPPDSLRLTLDAAEVSATRAARLDPVPFAEVRAPRLDPAFSGQELPVYLQRTPNVTSNATATGRRAWRGPWRQ